MITLSSSPISWGSILGNLVSCAIIQCWNSSWFPFRFKQVSKLSFLDGNTALMTKGKIRNGERPVNWWLIKFLMLLFILLVEHSASKGTENNQNMCMMYIWYDVLQRIFGNKCLKWSWQHQIKCVAHNRLYSRGAEVLQLSISQLWTVKTERYM